MRHDIVRTAYELHVATQCFNQAALAYNREARGAPMRVVARLLRFDDAMVVSPALANLLAKRRRRRGEAAVETERADTGEDTRFLDDLSTMTGFGVDIDLTRADRYHALDAQHAHHARDDPRQARASR